MLLNGPSQIQSLLGVNSPQLAAKGLCVPGMFGDWGGGSPPANLMGVKASEAQGRHREEGSEGSVKQGCEPTDRNWINRRQGRTS
jgi:hypothetical protein